MTVYLDCRFALLSTDSVKTFELSELMPVVFEQAERAMHLTGLSFPAVLMLQHKYRWQPGLMEEAYFSDPEKVLHSLRLEGSTATHPTSLSPNPLEAECSLCGDALAAGEARGLFHCRHFFCCSCWRDCAVGLVREWGGILGMRCPMDGCSELVDCRDILNLFSAEDARRRVSRSLLSAFVEASPRLRKCPSADCTCVVFAPPAVQSGEPVQCAKCNSFFCFHCGRDSHAPASCDQMALWSAKVDADGANIAMILTSTKACPACRERIEKNCGCNHMTCKCSYQFCWVCMGKWAAHSGDYYSCRNAKGLVENDDLADHHLFVDHYKRYLQHKDSSERDSAAVDNCMRNVRSILQRQPKDCSSHTNFDALHALLLRMRSTLCRARLCLVYGYVHSYFIQNETSPGGRTHVADNGALFIHRLGSLEETTEALSRFVVALVREEAIDMLGIAAACSKVDHWVATVLSDDV